MTFFSYFYSFIKLIYFYLFIYTIIDAIHIHIWDIISFHLWLVAWLSVSVYVLSIWAFLFLVCNGTAGSSVWWHIWFVGSFHVIDKKFQPIQWVWCLLPRQRSIRQPSEHLSCCCLLRHSANLRLFCARAAELPQLCNHCVGYMVNLSKCLFYGFPRIF